MSIETLIRAWKDPKFRSTLNSEDLPPNPAGDRLVEIDDEELRAMWGGQTEVEPSEGWICSHSGECSSCGNSCWNPTGPCAPK
jgi:mersacidin/lichenicidin family type 2 lantibiotic